MNLAKTLSQRLRAGALAVIVEDADETLAVSAANAAGNQWLPVRVISASAPDCMDVLANHATPGQGTLITLDLLRCFGQNPQVARMVREIALQNGTGGNYSRVVMVESPGYQMPGGLASDVEIIRSALPTVEELKDELDAFVKGQKIVLEGNGENRHALAVSVAGLPRNEASRLFARCYVENKRLDAEWLRKAKAQAVSVRLGGALTFIEPDAAEVGGLDNLKSWLDARRRAFGSAKAKEFGLPEPKGLLLLGIPGAGKSLTAKTIAKQWGLPLLRLDCGRLFGGLVGQSEANTRQAKEAAESCAPCVLWLDEIEKGLSGSKSGGASDGGTGMRVLGDLLSWLQDKTSPVFVVATANRIQDLPPELLRKGRFDEMFFVDLPNSQERSQILRIHLERRKRTFEQADIDGLVTASEGYTGAELEQAVIEGLYTAYNLGRDITPKDVLEAIRATVPISKTMSEEIKALRSWSSTRARNASKQPGLTQVEVSRPRMEVC